MTLQFLPLYTPWILLPLALVVGLYTQHLREQPALSPADSASLPHPAVRAGFRAISLSADSQYLDLLQADGTWRRHDAHTGKELGRHANEIVPFKACAISADRQQFAGKMSEDRFLLLQGSTRLWSDDLPGRQPHEEVRAVAWSSTGRFVAAVSGHGSLWVIELAEGQTVSVHHQVLDCPWEFVAWSPDERQLALIGDDRQVLIWDVAQASRRGKLAADCRLAGWSGDSSRLITYGYQTHLRVWDAVTMTCLKEHHAGSQFLLAAAISPAGRLAAFGEGDQILLWDLETDCLIDSLTEHDAPIILLQFDPSGDTLFSADSMGDLMRWRLKDSRPIWRSPEENL